MGRHDDETALCLRPKVHLLKALQAGNGQSTGPEPGLDGVSPLGREAAMRSALGAASLEMMGASLALPGNSKLTPCGCANPGFEDSDPWPYTERGRWTGDQLGDLQRSRITS